MTAEEIKRILKNTRRTIQFSPSRRYVELFNKEDIQNLLDCITNLQQDLDKANDIIEKGRQFYKCRMDEYAELKKENERLKEDNLLIKSANKLVSDNLHNYKSRCEKAIEYIKSYKSDYAPYELSDYNIRKLLNILNGSDEK